MKSILSLAVLILSAQSAWAQTVACDVRVTVDSAEPVVQTFKLEKVEDPHGSLTVFQLKDFGGITGLLGLMKDDVMVISLADTKGYGSSSHGNLAKGAIAHHQLILPSPGVGVNAIAVDCQYID